jgi:hypothetical protein
LIIRKEEEDAIRREIEEKDRKRAEALEKEQRKIKED